jgi:hypothetical protein
MMIPYFTAESKQRHLKSLMALSLALVFCVGAMPAHAQQNQPDQPQSTVAPQDSQAQGQPQEAQPDPAMQQPQQAAPPQGQPDQQAQGQPNQPVLPETLTLPAGSVIRVRVDEWISSDRSSVGDSFSAVLDQPIVVNGWVVARRGQAQTGHVSVVKKGQHGGTSQLGIDLPELTLVDGQQVATQTQLSQTSGGSSTDRNVAAVGTTTGVGAIIGAIAGGGTGAAIGAGVGATAGMIGVMSANGRPAVIAPETVLTFRLQAPVTISTANSQFAFQPVSQSDLNSRSPGSRPRMARPGPPPPPPYYYPYPYAYGYPYAVYPAPFFGFGYYGGFGRFGGFRR